MPGNRALLAMVATVEFALSFNLMSVAASLPLLAADLGGGMIGAGWAMTAYLLVFTGLLVLAGRAGDTHGHGRLYLAGVLTSAAGALGAGLASSLPVLLVARAIQGVGAAMVSGNGLALTASAFTGRRRSMAVATVAMSTSLASLAGIAAATFFREQFGWRGAFLLTLPLLALALGWAIAARVGQRGRPVGAPRPWNTPSAVALVLGMAALFLSFNHLHEGEQSFAAGWFYHTGLQALAVLALLTFLWAERRSASPLFLEPGLAQPAFLSSVLANGVLHTTMMGAVFLTPFFIESGLGLTAAATGVMLIALHAATPAMNLYGGWLYERLGPRLSRVGSMLILASGFAALGWLMPLGQLGPLLVLAVGISVGLGVFVTSNNLVAVNAAPTEHRGLGIGVLETMRQFGHALAVALIALLVGTTDLRAGDPALLLEGFSRSLYAMAGLAFLGALLSMPTRGRASQPQPLPSRGQ